MVSRCLYRIFYRNCPKIRPAAFQLRGFETICPALLICRFYIGLSARFFPKSAKQPHFVPASQSMDSGMSSPTFSGDDSTVASQSGIAPAESVMLPRPSHRPSNGANSSQFSYYSNAYTKNHRPGIPTQFSDHFL